MRVVRFYVSKPASFSSSSSFLRRTSTASSRTGPPQLAGLPRIRVFPAGPQPWAPDVEHMAEKCQVGCQRKCQYRCHKACQIGCQNRCQIECQNRLSDRTPDQNLRRLYHIYFQVICQKLWQISVRVGVTRNKVIVYVIFRCLWLSPVPPWFSSFFHGVPNARWFRSIFHGFIVFFTWTGCSIVFIGFSMVHVGFSMALSNLTVVFIENSMVLIVHGFHRCSMVFGRCFHAFNRLLDGFHRFVCGFIQCFLWFSSVSLMVFIDVSMA